MAVAKLRILRFCRVCQAPCSPCAYRIARSRRSAVPYTAWTKCRQRGGQLRDIGGSLLRSQSRAFHLLLHWEHVVWSNCDFSVLSGPGVLYHVPIACTNTAGRSEEFFSESSTLISITEIRYLFGVRAWNLHPRMESTSLL